MLNILPQSQLIQIQRAVALAITQAQEDGRYYAHYQPVREINLTETSKRIAHKVASRRRIGWFDFSLGSHDMAGCSARAYRIQQRLIGNRLSFYQAMWG